MVPPGPVKGAVAGPDAAARVWIPSSGPFLGTPVPGTIRASAPGTGGLWGRGAGEPLHAPAPRVIGGRAR